MPHQIAITLSAQLRTDSDSPLRVVSGPFHGGSNSDDQLRWAGLPSVHFARLLRLDESIDLQGNVIPASLIYMADVDVPVRRHLRDLVAQSRAGVDEVFGQCVGYPAEPTDDARLVWLAAHQIRAAAYYVRREVKDIENEAELVTYLAAPDRRWALMPTERLADVDVAFRRRTGRHLFVPDAENARVSLVANQASISACSTGSNSPRA